MPVRLSDTFIKGLSVQALTVLFVVVLRAKRRKCRVCGLIPIKHIRTVACGKEGRIEMENGNESKSDSNKRAALPVQKMMGCYD